jgi:uncharacterized protein YjbJ (UPF0337 family)
MNESIIKGKWQEIKGEIQRMWGKVTGDELDQTKGNLKSVAGIIRQKYGTKEEEVSTRLNELVSKYRRDTAGKADAAADRLKDELKRH